MAGAGGSPPTKKFRFYFPGGRELTSAIQRQIAQYLQEALAGWTDHNEPIQWEVTFPWNKLVCIEAWKASGTRIDGCAQDVLFRVMRELAGRLHLPLLDFSQILVVEGGEARFFPGRAALKAAWKKGELTPDARVFLYGEEGRTVPVASLFFLQDREGGVEEVAEAEKGIDAVA